MVATVARKSPKKRTVTNGKPKAVKVDPVAHELRRIYRSSGNRLHPPDVVRAARSPSSVLHRYFMWDDTEAAAEYRLMQARHLIATVRIIVPHSATETRKVRAYHALRSDQNGYRHMKDIVDAPDLLESLVSQFAADLDRVQERYQAIRETAAARRVFEVIEEFCGRQKHEAA